MWGEKREGKKLSMLPGDIDNFSPWIGADGNETILKRCRSVSGAKETLVQQVPNIAWVSFDLQEHKIHNNVALVMEHKLSKLSKLS